MSAVTPIQQPPIEDLRNALQIAEMGPDLFQHLQHEQDAGTAFGDIARLIRHALDQLGEPNLASVQAVATMIREYEGSNIAKGDLPRYARDTAAVILRAQVEGITPLTWSE